MGRYKHEQRPEDLLNYLVTAGQRSAGDNRPLRPMAVCTPMREGYDNLTGWAPNVIQQANEILAARREDEARRENWRDVAQPREWDNEQQNPRQVEADRRSHGWQDEGGQAQARHVQPSIYENTRLHEDRARDDEFLSRVDWGDNPQETRRSAAPQLPAGEEQSGVWIPSSVPAKNWLDILLGR